MFTEETIHATSGEEIGVYGSGYKHFMKHVTKTKFLALTSSGKGFISAVRSLNYNLEIDQLRKAVVELLPPL